MTAVSTAETAESAELHGFWTRSRKAGVALGALGTLTAALALPLRGLSVTAEFNVTLGVASTFPAGLTTFVLGGLCALAGAALFTGREQNRFALLTVSGIVAMSLGLLVAMFAPAGRSVPLESLLAGGVALSLPLMFGALAGAVCERSGVINVGIEGQLLTGAFTGAMVSSMTSSATAGLLAGAVSGSLVTLLLAYLTVRYQVDQVVAGVILNLLMLGLTGFLYDKFMQVDAARYNHPTPAPDWTVPLLGDIPIVGPAIFRQNVFTYLAIGFAIGLWILLFRTRWGLRTRAVGEHPAAADTVGINVNWLRFRNVWVAGLLSGIGGAYFTVGTGIQFIENMPSGKGFIALAVLIVGRWHPLGAMFGALLFGFADRVQQYLGSDAPIPSEFLAMLPYIVTIVAVAGLIGRVRPPAADGKPYIKS